MSDTSRFRWTEQVCGERMDDLLLAAGRDRPDAAAVIELDETGAVSILSYGELVTRVEAWATTLAELGLTVGARVIVESDTSGAAVTLLLACSRLGLTFVPVSPEMPDQRLRAVVEAAEPALYARAASTQRAGTEAWLPSGIGTVLFGPEGLEVTGCPRSAPTYRREVVGTDPAYVIFTSGTTGRPKGVVMSHRAVMAFYRGMLHEGLVGPGDRVATTSPLQFDFSLLDVGLALGSGAAVVPVPRPLLRWPRRFLRVLRDSGATQINGVPSIWRSALRHERERLAELTQVRGILFCGEEFPLPELRALQDALPQARLVNCYGATESMACSFTNVPRPLPEGTRHLSIGFAHRGAEMLLVGDDGAPVNEPGRVGQIHLRSPALFTGYWGDRDATHAALVPDPLEPRSGQSVLRTGDLAYRGIGGELYFCGRADSQVQVRGNRVELGEVERRLLDFPGVASAAALLLQNDCADGELIAFAVPADRKTADDVAALSAFCRQALPDYMVPRRLHFVQELPVNENGKIDRAALASAARNQPARTQ